MISRTKAAWSAGVLVASALVAVAPGAQAHNLTGYCGDSNPVKWNSTSTTYWRSDSWGQLYRDGITNGVSSFNTSDFDFYSASVFSAMVTWNDLNDPDTNIAGYAYLSVSCPSHTIGAGSLYYNFPHFNTAGHTTTDRYTCTAIHEMGHMVGLAHQNTYTSILNTPHGSRCHPTSGSPITTLQSHDTSDINAKY